MKKRFLHCTQRSHARQWAGLSLCVLTGIGLGACSQGDSAQGGWPEPEFSEPERSSQDEEVSSQAPQDSSEPDEGSPGEDEDSKSSSRTNDDGSPDDSTQEEDPSTEVETTRRGTSSPEDSTRETTRSATSSTNSSSEDASTSNEVATDSTRTQDSSSSGSDPEPEPRNCPQELCVGINANADFYSGAMWKAGRNMFAFDTPPGNRRLARIELVEGFARGTTLAEIRPDRGDSSASVLARLRWDVDLVTSQAWMGADLEPPLRMNSSAPLYVVVTPILNSRASFAASGKQHQLWYLPIGGDTWRPGDAPLMFRAYCCKDEP